MTQFSEIEKREAGLQRRLTSGQMSMIAIGGAIGTGLFMGSAFAVGVAGPSVILSYAIGAVITLLLMGCLAEMTVEHSTSGSFGAYAEMYIGPMAGFFVRYAYWVCIVLAVGTEITAVATYMKYWFPSIPGLVWIGVFSAILIGVNALNVKIFGTVEYIFSSIKVIAILVFIGLGGYLLFFSGTPEFTTRNLVQYGGFFPNGFMGTWIAVIIAIFSYLSVEMIAVAAGEAEDPEKAVKQAFKATIIRLVLFYLATLFLIMSIVPWQQIDNNHSPFVKFMEVSNIPYAADIINAVILVAALSAMNSQLYITTRMMFSLSRAGFALPALGKVNKRQIPLNALIVSSIGIAFAAGLYTYNPDTAFSYMIAISMFGALFTWAMIFLTHLFFRHHMKKAGKKLRFQLPGFPVTTLLGFVLMVVIILSTAFVPMFSLTLVFGIPLLLLFFGWYKWINHLRQKAVGGK